MTPLVLLAGNPNSGKTTLFNRLTGSRAKVANYPGVTVSKLSGMLRLDGGAAIEVVDLLEQPHLAKADEILAIPTLVRRLPPPLRKIIGDLSNVDRVLLGLDIVSLADGPRG